MARKKKIKPTDPHTHHWDVETSLGWDYCGCPTGECDCTPDAMVIARCTVCGLTLESYEIADKMNDFEEQQGTKFEAGIITPEMLTVTPKKKKRPTTYKAKAYSKK
jgi:hypothetical protein